MDFAKIASQVTEGEINPLGAYIDLKKAEDAIKKALAIVQPLAIDEANKWSEKSFKFNGAFVEKRNAAASWDFSECAAYNQAKERLKYIEQMAKIGGGVDPNTGEEINKAIKIEGASTIAIKLPKDENNS